MSVLDELRPKQKLRIMDLLADAGIDVSHWKDYKGKHPAANPKYCYNWSFEQPGELVAVCLWHSDLKYLEGQILYHRLTDLPERIGPGEPVWRRRDTEFGIKLELAYRQQLPVRVVILEGVPYDVDRGHTEASEVEARLLDPISWAVTKYNYVSRNCTLVRGAKPVVPAVDASDFELAWFEGEARRHFILHRRREGAARREKIKEVLARNGGSLTCEVPRCGFDFSSKYGRLGEGYAHVHHLKPLKFAPKEGRKTILSDLAIVCPNCHAMIHLGGQCRDIANLIVGTEVGRA
jgi:5-methylcytosine-specific restriction enzyme A